TDHSGTQPYAYHVPLTYRGSPLPDAAEATKEQAAVARTRATRGPRTPSAAGAGKTTPRQ
ncbi:hypothetical protein ABZ894_32300, partial [Nocardia beijingensis]